MAVHRRPRTRSAVAMLAAAVIGALTVLVAPPAMACACGGMVLPPGADSSVDREIALVTRDGTDETIHMQLAVDADTDDIGLLVPLPAPAELTLGEQQLFDDLERAIAPRPREEFELFGPPLWFDAGTSSGGAPEGVGGGVTVVGEVDLGPLQAVTLRADDPRALQAWLDENGYELADGLSTAMQPYLDEGWVFVAARLTQEGQDLQGELPPLVMQFPSDDLVYPMRMSTAAEQTQYVRTYVLSDHRMQRTDATAADGPGSAPQTLFAGTVATDGVQSEQLRSLVGEAPYLTAIDQTFGDPAEQIVSDFTFGQAADDTEYHRTYTVMTYGIPIDVAIVVGLLLIVGVGVVVWWMVRRRRSRPVAQPSRT